MSHSRLAAIVIDCLPEHFEDSVAFWAAALGTPSGPWRILVTAVCVRGGA